MNRMMILFALVAATHQQEYKYYIFPIECYDQYYKDNTVELNCLIDAVSRTLSIMIVIFSVFNQAPQIYKIIKSKSVEGVSFNATYFECYLINFNIAYNLHQGTDFMLYGENVSCLIQFLIKLALYLVYDQSMTKQSFGLRMIMFGLINGPLLVGYGPQILFDCTIYVNMALLLFSRLPQLWMNCKNRHTGQLSFWTQIQNQAGAITRTFTLFISSNDLLYTSLVLEDNILSGLLTSQFCIYYRNDQKKSQYQYQVCNVKYLVLLDIWYNSYWELSHLVHQLVIIPTIQQVKRQIEHPKRLWKIFMLDSSKQMMSALLSHILNVILALELATKESSNPCVWYFITYFLDTTLGVLICYIIMKSIDIVFKKYNFKVLSDSYQNLQSGNYFKIDQESKLTNHKKPAVTIDWKMYLIQLLVWNTVVITSKCILYGFQQLFAIQLEQFANFLFSPITNPQLELILVMMVIPVILNSICFWIQDTILKKTEFNSEQERAILIGTFYEEEQSEQSTQELVQIE